MNFFRKYKKSDILLFIIHAFNLCWIIRIFLLHTNAEGKEINYLGDAYLLLLLLTTSAIHVFRWDALFKSIAARLITTSIDLRSEMRLVAESMYKKIPYLLSLMPNENVLQIRAQAVVQDNTIASVRSMTDVCLLIFNIKNYMLINNLLGAISVVFLMLGGLPSYAKLLNSIPIIVPLMMCIAAGFAIYCSATLIYYVLLSLKKG